MKFYEDFNAFKLFMLDVGLMGAMVDAPAAAMIVGNSVFTEYRGAFTELYVCMQIQGIKLPLFSTLQIIPVLSYFLIQIRAPRQGEALHISRLEDVLTGQ